MVTEEEGSRLDDLNDNDFMQYGIIPVLKLNDAWTIKGYFRYNDDARECHDDKLQGKLSWEATTETGEKIVIDTTDKDQKNLAAHPNPHADQLRF